MNILKKITIIATLISPFIAISESYSQRRGGGNPTLEQTGCTTGGQDYLAGNGQPTWACSNGRYVVPPKGCPTYMSRTRGTMVKSQWSPTSSLGHGACRVPR